ncbi:hypothetical protein KY311_02560 [Candidatus Woesearchaeota archaeon]|nr:hypothetical protein [Candidatus Woesearchaeota archaeon]MBW3017431.1 hypothetical protein [Candidatus Woesearchaeota archaeon]
MDTEEKYEKSNELALKAVSTKGKDLETAIKDMQQAISLFETAYFNERHAIDSAYFRAELCHMKMSLYDYHGRFFKANCEANEGLKIIAEAGDAWRGNSPRAKMLRELRSEFLKKKTYVLSDIDDKFNSKETILWNKFDMAVHYMDSCVRKQRYEDASRALKRVESLRQALINEITGQNEKNTMP